MLKPIQCTHSMWINFKKKCGSNAPVIKGLRWMFIETSESMLHIGVYLESSLLFKVNVRLDTNTAQTKFLHDYINYDDFKSLEGLLYTIIDSYKDHLNKILSKIE